MIKPIVVRLLPVIMLTAAAAVWFNDVQEGGPYVVRNLAPLLLLVLLAAISLWRGQGAYTGQGARWALGAAGYAIPALGLAAYLHYAYSVNLDGLFDASEGPGQLFRFLPYYSVGAGGLGFAIGWIIGRNL